MEAAALLAIAALVILTACYRIPRLTRLIDRTGQALATGQPAHNADVRLAIFIGLSIATLVVVINH